MLSFHVGEFIFQVIIEGACASKRHIIASDRHSIDSEPNDRGAPRTAGAGPVNRAAMPEMRDERGASP